MSDRAQVTAQSIIEGIRSGMVPRQIRLFAAQGLLPVARDDLFRIQVLLSADGDEELARLARKSLAEVEPEAVVATIGGGALEAIELDLLARLRQEEVVWAAIASSRAAADETLRTLARHGTPLIQDILITNQVRVLACLEILEDLRSNPRVTQIVLRRVREFEEEFIDKAVEAQGELPPPEAGPTLEEALAELKQIGGNIPSEDELPYPESEREPEEVDIQRMPIHTRIHLMSTFEKIMTGLKGTREERAILILSVNRLVVRAVLASPKLSDNEIERFASSRAVSDEVISTIAGNPRWMRRYGVILALAQNPKTPPRISMQVLPRLNMRDLDRVSKDRNVPAPVRRQAQLMREKRR